MKKIFTCCIFFIQSVCAQDAIPFLVYNGSVSCTGIKDQYRSSTCWSFAGNSFIESEVIRNKGIYADLSEMFIARYSYKNKIRRYLSTGGKTFFTPGGQFHDIIKVIKEYGIMPEEIYSGKANGEKQHDHGELDTLMKHFADRLLVEGKKSPSGADMAHIDHLLDKYLGKVPSAFMFEGKSYTARAFAADYLHFNPDDYIEITSYNHHPYYEKYILEDRYNWTGDLYYNVPLDDMIAITQAALRNNYSVCWDGDVTERGFDFYKGIATHESIPLDAADERQRTFDDKSSAIDHMMHIIAFGKDKNNNTWYKIKNSWGKGNPANGYLYMDDTYFSIKTIAIIVNKNAIPPEIRKKLKV